MNLLMTSIVCFSLFTFGSGGTGGSGGSGGGSGIGAASGGGNRADESRPAKVKAAQEELRRRMQKKLASSNTGNSEWITIDHSHTELDQILKSSVTLVKGGQKSYIDYRKVDRPLLMKYLKSMSSVSKNQVYNQFTKDQRLAFYINLYNGYTIELILRHLGKIKSIKDIGGFFSSPWKKRFFKLYGEDTHLDEIEHGYIRGAKDFSEPRIHFAVNCASKGCPALLNEAFVANRLEEQLETAFVNFLKDRDRNRYNKKRGRVELSPIFDWYEGDFEKGLLGFKSLKDVVRRYAVHLSDDPQIQEKMKSGKLSIRFSDYDWTLNDSI